MHQCMLDGRNRNSAAFFLIYLYRELIVLLMNYHARGMEISVELQQVVYMCLSICVSCNLKVENSRALLEQ